MYILNDKEKSLIAELGRLADQHIAPAASDADLNGTFVRSSIDALGQAGFWGLTVPEEHGGHGAGLACSVAAVDTVAQRCASTAMVYLMHLCGVAAYNASPGTMAPYLRQAAEGKHLTTLAWSERGSRSHFWAPVSKALRNGDHVTLNAEKSWVTSANEADGYVATIGNENEGIDLYLVMKGDSGLSVSSGWDSMGMRGNASSPMKMDGVTLSTNERKIGEPGEAFGVMMGAVLPQFALGNAGCSIGCAEAAVGATANHLTTKKFEHLGANLASLPNLRERLARMRTETDMARAHVSGTIQAALGGDEMAQLYVLESKAQAAETAVSVTDKMMAACGGAAFSRHVSMDRIFRDARAMTVMAPTTDVLYDMIGKVLTGQELF